MSAEFLPCPFCGGPARTDFIEERHSYLIECHDCDARGPICDDKNRAVAAWNRRADELLRTLDKMASLALCQITQAGSRKVLLEMRALIAKSAQREATT